MLIGEVDLTALEDIRRNWPFLRDRRIDSLRTHHAAGSSTEMIESRSDRQTRK